MRLLKKDLEGVKKTARQLDSLQSDVGRLTNKVDGYFSVWTEESEGVASQLRDLWKDLLMLRKNSAVSQKLSTYKKTHFMFVRVDCVAFDFFCLNMLVISWSRYFMPCQKRRSADQALLCGPRWQASVPTLKPWHTIQLRPTIFTRGGCSKMLMT